MDSISSWFPPTSVHTFSTTLSHLIPARPCVTFSHTALSAMAGTLFFGMFLTFYCHFNFLTSLFVLSGYIPSSALDIVLLVVLEHPSTFLDSVICTDFQLFYQLRAFPSHVSPAYSSFGTITLIRIHILILVSRCESGRIASILPTCALPFPMNFAMWGGVGRYGRH